MPGFRDRAFPCSCLFPPPPTKRGRERKAYEIIIKKKKKIGRKCTTESLERNTRERESQIRTKRRKVALLLLPSLPQNRSINNSNILLLSKA